MPRQAIAPLTAGCTRGPGTGLRSGVYVKLTAEKLGMTASLQLASTVMVKLEKQVG